MKKLTLLIVLFIAMAGAFAQQLIIDTIYFQFDRHNITPESKAEIDSLISDFSQYPSFFVQIYGHTDSIGTPAYNLALSEARAKEIALYMNENGVHLSRIDYAGLGTSKPVSSNDTYAGRRKNRRADIAVVFSNEPFVSEEEKNKIDSAALVITEPVEVAPVVIVDTIYCDYTPFLINPLHKSVIIAPEGTKITVPNDAFDTDADEITFEFKELFFRKDMIMNEMPTISKDGPLEATGMFMFNATDGRRPARFKPDVNFEVDLPATRRDTDMAVYSGSGGNRGGNRNRGSRGQSDDDESTGFNAVQTWNEQKDVVVGYKGRERAYTFKVDKPGRYTVARPLYHSQNTDPEDNGMDILVKLKGRRYEKTTNVMVVGEVVKTYIPLKKQGKSIRNYEATRVKYLDAKTDMIMVAIQYDDQGNPWLAKRSFQPGQLIKERKKDTKKNSKSRPEIKMKVKFRKMTKERLNELLTELNA
ncbi:MAG: OmpA family protein [Bacteroidetes bacterium]|nr:OmpA family protein [Bacteroidota bacterium]MCB0841861.1 OmpA family protein [Bacteroidota bacterium]